MPPTIAVTPTSVELRSGNLIAQADRSRLCFAHLGWSLLGTLKEVPGKLAERWVEQFGRTWKKTNEAPSGRSPVIDGKPTSGVGRDLFPPGSRKSAVPRPLFR